MEKVLRDILTKHKDIFRRREDLIAALDSEIPPQLSSKYSIIKKAIELGVSEKFASGNDRYDIKRRVAEMLRAENFQEDQIKYIVETFSNALNWSNFDTPTFSAADHNDNEYKPPVVNEKISDNTPIKAPVKKSLPIVKIFMTLVIVIVAASAYKIFIDINSTHQKQASDKTSSEQVNAEPLREKKVRENYRNAKTELSLNGMDLITPVNQMLNTWGDPNSIDKGELVDLYCYDNLKVNIKNSTLISFWTDNPFYKTLRGIHVDSTYQEVIDAYGESDLSLWVDNARVHYYEFPDLKGRPGMLKFAVNKSDVVEHIDVISEDVKKPRKSQRQVSMNSNAQKLKEFLEDVPSNNNKDIGGGNNKDTGGGNNKDTGGGNNKDIGGGNNKDIGGGNNKDIGGGNNKDIGSGNNKDTGSGNNHYHVNNNPQIQIGP